MIFQLIFVQLLTFAGLVFVLRKILITSSYKETSRLQQLNEENAQKSQELAAKIADAEIEYRNKMAKADDEIREMKTRAKKETEQLKETLVSVGKAEGARIVAQALNTKEEIRAEVEQEMKGKSIVLSCRLFQKVLTSNEQKLVYDGLLESVFQELDNLDSGRLKSVDAGSLPDGIIEVRSSHSMSLKQKEKLEKILSSKLDQSLTIKEVIDREVISGIIITVGSFVIDGSLSERLKKAAEALD